MAFVQTIEVQSADETLLREQLAAPRYADYRLVWATGEGS